MLLTEAALDYLIKHPAYIEVSFAQGCPLLVGIISHVVHK